ncbi:IclR family transcriptional regulator [Alphaproteobacteria bacterium]|nr:IclR family transcriptional regulator [Alphaproteobacteria bacterium]MDB9825469.1 IclR family transcriptional regulator [Alphaproteobacteria bacterium]
MQLLKSLSKGLKVIELLSDSRSPLRLTDISNKLESKKSNTSHILKSLMAAGYVSQDSSRHYYLSNKLTDYEQSHSIDSVVNWKEKLQPILKELTYKTGECTYLAVRANNKVWYIDKVDSLHSLKVDHPIGNLAPLHCTALGKTFLAFEDIKIDWELKKYTDKTIDDKKKLLKEISKIRLKGFAEDDEEYAEGIRCVARPILDKNFHIVAAIGISAPTIRFNDNQFEKFGSLIKELIK